MFMEPNPEIVIRLEQMNAYKREREQQYGQIAAQLDMLWHDINNGVFGEAAKTGTFFTHIQSVKDSVVKPDNLDQIKAEVDALIAEEMTNNGNI